jgi:anaerobic dimethyl sulfoxide reductase subunit C (anchor subunit)
METQWPLVLFTLLAGTGAGMLVLAGAAELMGAASKARGISGWLAAVLLALGGLASVAHLGKPANVMSAVSNLGSLSGISVELIMLVLGLVAAIAYALASRSGSGAAKGVGVACLVVGLVFCWSLGSSYSIASRPLWATPALPFAYLGSGLALGAFAYLGLLAARGGSEDAAKLAPVALAASAVELVAFLAFGVSAGSAAMADNGLLFWAGSVVVGAGVPLLCAFLIRKDAAKGALAWAGLAGAVVGGVAFRALMWALGSSAIPNLFDVAATSRGLFPF